VLTFLSWLTDISLRRATVLVVVVVALFVAGVLAATQIKLELYPDIDFPAMTVVSTYPGASPQDVTDDVSQPIEQAASTLAGLKRMESVSSEGLSILLLEFGFGTDMEKQEQDLSKRLGSIAFPSTVSEPRITLINPQLIPVSELSLKGDISLDALESIAQEKVVPALTKLDGVLQVDDPTVAAIQMRAVIEGMFLQWLQTSNWRADHPGYREHCRQALLRVLGATTA